MTMMQSALRTVESLCATTSDVRPSIMRSNASCTCSSVRVSMELVASSRSSTAGSHIITRAMHSSWRCPCERAPPPSPTSVW